MTDIAQLGYSVDSSQLVQGTTNLDKHTAAAQRTDAATGKFEKQVKRLSTAQHELVFAQRQLPMQFTDIATSLATGQRPMMVFLQQGGQLKDLYGGIGPAIRAMSGYVMSLVNPFTLAAGAAALLVAAWADAAEDSTAFNRALLVTGNYADRSQEQLEALVDQLASLEGVSHGGARDALLQTAAAGRFTGEQFDEVARAAARMEVATGQAVEDTVKKFAEIEKDPVKALLKLNETEHFLTQTQLDRVQALVDEQKEQEAAALGAQIYAGRLDDIADAAEQARPHLSRLWQEAKEGASEAWETTKDFAEFLAAAGEQFNQMPWWKKLGPTGGMLSVIKALNAAEPTTPTPIAKVPGAIDSKEAKAAIEAAEQAQREFDRYRIQGLTRALKLEEDIAKMRAAGLVLGKKEADLAKVEADMRARAAEHGRKRKETDPTDALVKRLQDQIALNLEAAASEDHLTATERMLVQVRTDLERIGAKGSETNRKLIATLMEEAAASDAAAQAAERQRRAAEALAQLQERIGLAEQNRRRSNEADLMGLMGAGEATQMLRRQLELHRWYEDQVVELRRQAAREKREVTADEEQALKDSLARQLEEERRFQQARQALMGDWRVGAARALEGYMERSRDIASQVEEIWTEAFNTFEDIGTDALTGNLQSWGDYFDNLHAMIARFLVRQQLTSWMQTLFTGGNTSSDAGTIFDLLGSFGNGGFFGGGRALGGDMRGDRIYQVGERNRPELANIGGKQWLIPGDRGNVEPIRGDRSRAAPVQVTQNFYSEGRIDPRTATQMQQDAAMKMRTATARNS